MASLKEILHKEIKLFIAVFVIVFTGLLFIFIAAQVTTNSTTQFDENIIKSLRDPQNYSQPAAPQWVTIAMVNITSLGSGAVLTLVTLSVMGFLILHDEYNSMWFILGATIGGTLITLGLKEFFERPRPDVIFQLVNVNSLSFPSGHSVMSAVVYLTQASLLARIQRKKSARAYILIIALLLTLLIGISRIYLGVHYPTDVLAGWCVGLAWATLCWLGAFYLLRHRKLKKIS